MTFVKKVFPVSFTKEFKVALLLLAVVAIGLFLNLERSRASVSTAETRFVELSKSGYQIVPASCPSQPHYSGECSTPPQPSSGCVITANPSTISTNGSTDLAWSSVVDYDNPWTRTLPPIVGNVAWASSVTLAPNVTTTYTLTGTRGYAYGQPTSFSCSVTVTVNPPACVPTSVCSGGNVTNSCTGAVTQLCSYGCSAGACSCVNICSGNNVVNSCTGALVQTCSYACSSGSCVAPPPPTVSFQVTPKLLKSGRTAVVTWSSTNTTACTVTEDNPNITDSWTGTSNTRTTSAIAEQTTYRLSCTGLDTSVVTRSLTVNIVPTWQEQ